ETTVAHALSAPNIRIDSLLEMRERLVRVWKALREMPRADVKAYLLSARDTSGEDLINLFLHVEATTEDEVASLLELSLEEFTDLRLNRLPLEISETAEQLGMTPDRVYKRRYRIGKRLKAALI